MLCFLTRYNRVASLGPYEGGRERGRGGGETCSKEKGHQAGSLSWRWDHGGRRLARVLLTLGFATGGAALKPSIEGIERVGK